LKEILKKLPGFNRKHWRTERSKSSLYWQRETSNKQKLLVLQVKLPRYLQKDKLRGPSLLIITLITRLEKAEVKSGFYH